MANFQSLSQNLNWLDIWLIVEWWIGCVSHFLFMIGRPILHPPPILNILILLVVGQPIFAADPQGKWLAAFSEDLPLYKLKTYGGRGFYQKRKLLTMSFIQSFKESVTFIIVCIFSHTY